MEPIITPVNLDNKDRMEKEIDNKVAKILKLIRTNVSDKKGKNPADPDLRTVLVELIEDVYKEYRSLHSRYDHIRSDTGQENSPARRNINKSFSASSSEMEYYSPDENDNRNTRIENQDTMDRKHKSSPVKIEDEDTDPWDKGKILEHSELTKLQEDHGDQGSPKMKELEGQLALVKTELESARGQLASVKTELESACRVNEELEQINTELNGQMSELEKLLKQKEYEMGEMKKTLKDNENNLTSRVNGLRDQLDQAQQEFETLHRQKSEQQDQLRVKTDEVTQIQMQLKSLKDELQTEKDSLPQKLEDMKQEIQDLHVHIKSLEEIRNNDVDRSRDERERLHTRISELEEMLSERNDELRTFQKIHKDQENESSTLRQQIKSLKDELDSLQSEKKRLERENEKLQLDHEQSRMEFENEVQKLKARIEDQRRALKEHQDSIKKLEQQSKPMRFHSLDSSRSKVDTAISQHLLERKVQELADNFNMNMENNIRLLSQRIHVAEQIHTDTKDDYKKIKEQLEKENKALNAKTAAFEAEAREMRDTLMEVGISMVTGLDALVKKIGESNDNFFERLSMMADEVHLVKIWITNKVKELQHDVKTLQAELDSKNKKELRLRDEVRQLSAKLINGLPMAIEEKVSNLEEQLRVKESQFLELGEEKREAIRQLCVLIDHHRNRYDHLKKAMIRMSAKTRDLPKPKPKPLILE